jgi:alginate production protein
MRKLAFILLCGAAPAPAMAASPRIEYLPVALVESAAPSVEPPTSAPVATSLPVKARPVIVRPKDDDDRPPETPLEIARELGLSGDDSRPEAQLETTLFGKRLIVGGEIGAGARYRSNYELLPNRDDDDLTFDPEGKLEAIWLPSDSSAVFVSGKLFAESTLYRQGGSGEFAAGAELNEAWLLKTGLFGTPLALQIGRQQVQDRREWWWDEDLDAVRLHYFGRNFRAFVGIGREFGHKSTLGRLEPEDRRIVRVFGNARWTWTDRNELEIYALHQNDRSGRFSLGALVDSDQTDESDAKLTWLGFRARGRVKTGFPGKFYYWADIARVRGSEQLTEFSGFDANRDVVTGLARQDVHGWAIDVGASLELPFAFEPYLTLGYARGSGDLAGGDGIDRSFRQTGLQNNNGKFRGLSRFRYYGEVLRPELANIRILTVAFGVPLGKGHWLETVWHDYRQPVAARRIAGSRLDIDPLGTDSRLGQGVDVIYSYRPGASPWEFELTAGGFRAGPAFGPAQGRWAGLIELKLDFNF